MAPLADVRVLDLSRLLPGPMATLQLAELGAEVISIVSPFEQPAGGIRGVLECMLSRGKRVIRLNLAHPAGREILLRLACRARVIMEGFRPGVAERLGIGYEAVRALQPAIVYCSITGYGQTGPDRLRAGHDINYLAYSGLADQIGPPDGPPVLPNLQIGDILGGSMTAVARILAALVGGEASHIDVSMADSLLSYALPALARVAATGHGAPRGEDLLSGGLPCYHYYRTADGRYLAVGALEPKFWDRLCEVVNRVDWKDRRTDPRLREELQSLFATRDSVEWLRLLEGVDCCVTLVLTLDEAISRTRIALDAPPLVPQTDSILRDEGFAQAEIERFRAGGVI